MFPNPRQFVGLQIVFLSGGRPEFAAAARRIGKRSYGEAPPTQFGAGGVGLASSDSLLPDGEFNRTSFIDEEIRFLAC
jgi:hypothetical protein